jgi:hypothetical protein
LERQEIQDRMQDIEKITLQADQAIITGQLEINKAEAMSASFFKGGWRPAVGWVCVIGLFYQFIVRTILPWCIEVGAQTFHAAVAIPQLPALDMGTLMMLLSGMLGLGGFRTFEKIKGI